MAKLTFAVTVQDTDSTNQYTTSMEFDLEDLRKTPNPRQALVSHFLFNVREMLKEIDPTLHI